MVQGSLHWHSGRDSHHLSHEPRLVPLDRFAHGPTSSPTWHLGRGTRMPEWSESRASRRRCDQQEAQVMLVGYGGDLSAGSGRSCAGNIGRAPSCAHQRKWITSLPAIVASNQGDFGQGRVRCSCTGAPRFITFSFSWPSFPSFDLCPYPNNARTCTSSAWLSPSLSKT